MNKIYKLFWVFCLLSSVAQGQERTITGKIISATDGQPLPGASVYVPSKTITTQTPVKGLVESVGIGQVADFDGNFSLKIPVTTKQIAVSFVGFETQIITLSDKKNYYKISLQEEANALQEVIVTGYQKIEKRKLTSSVAKVQAKDILQAGAASIDQLLQGQVAGMVTTTETGSPGEISKIRIRGTASLSGSPDPLWVIDGLPLEGNEVPDLSSKGSIDELRNYSIAGINPDDIQDITILKDAAATAIYGARAANGVIVITTKKGKKGKMSVNISANTFVTQRPDFEKLNLMNSSQKVDFELYMTSQKDFSFRKNKGEVARILEKNNEYDTYQNAGFSALSGQTQNAINALRSLSPDWGKKLYRTAFNQQYTASISGGSERNTYYFSLGYYDEQGTTVGTGFKRYNVSLSNSYALSERFKINATVLASQTNKNTYLTGTDSFTNPAYYSRNVNPYFMPYDAQGGYAYDQDILGLDDRYVPFNFLEERKNTSHSLDNQSVKAILGLEFSVLKNLTYVSELGLQIEKNSTEKFAEEQTYYARKYRERSRYYDSSTRGYKYFVPQGGIIQNNNDDFFQYNWKNTLQYNAEFAQRHELDLMLGAEVRYNKSQNIGTKAFGFDSNTLTSQQIIFRNQSDANSSLYRAYQKSETENAFASFYATASYTYDKKYTLFSSIRYDGSNLFGVDPKYKYLPLWAVSGSWLVSEEDFFSGSEIFPYLRLRASYGLQGNIDKNTSPFVIGYYGTTTLLPGYPQPTIRATSPPNDKLRWEKTQNYNIGFDAGFLNNRVRIAADFYRRVSSDLIGVRSLPLENGFNYSTVNWARISNKGYEFTLNTKNINREHFKWNTTLSFSHNKSNVDQMQVRENDRLPSREGLPVNAVFALKTNGLDAEGLPVFVDKQGKDASMVDFFKLYDLYATFFPGVVSGSELKEADIRELYTYIGDRDPKFSGGIVNTFSYKNIELSVTGNFNLEQTMVRTPPYNPAQLDRGLNYSTDVLNSWKPNHTQTSMPRIVDENTLTAPNAWMAYQWLAGNDATYGINTIGSLDIWAKKMSYLRLTSIRLGYSLPKDVVAHLGLESLKINLEGRNLFVFSTDYSGFFDPETYGNPYAQPVAQSVTLGLNLSF